jgi:hypothetical protein
MGIVKEIFAEQIKRWYENKQPSAECWSFGQQLALDSI